MPPMPGDRGELRRWLADVLGVRVSERALDGGNESPLDYLAWSFFEPGHASCVRAEHVNDCVVWACRGGGKTFYGAIATLLDLVYKPGVEVVIIGGSLKQSRRMYKHLKRFLERPRLARLVEGKVTETGLRLVNGSAVELSSQAQTSVRGARPQKVRCDEVDLFDESVWRAVQLTTVSKDCGGVNVRGGLEALSTWHRRGGVMSDLVDAVTEQRAKGEEPTRKLFKWGIIDVLKRCDERHACEGCVLWEECRGVAKTRADGGGHVAIDDAVELKRRVDLATWRSEMLCEGPSTHGSVFPSFSVGRHVVMFEIEDSFTAETRRTRRETEEGNDSKADSSVGGNPRRLPRAAIGGTGEPARVKVVAAGGAWYCGMDFGFRSPTVVLWVYVDAGGVMWVVDERIETGVVMSDHAQAIVESKWPPPLKSGTKPGWVAIDPAGMARNDQTGVSTAEVLRGVGLKVRAERVPVEEGLKAVRARLSPAVGGEPRLFIHPRCKGLIQAMREYRYPGLRVLKTASDEAEGGGPVKDGADHAADALRYLVVSLDCRGALKREGY
ncbi:MAG TPA: hypothetical protein VG797_10035 [Phycisphaerales bacterium]|nr:hypothetical protein [Phycisphaerales bacterium]